MDALLFIALLGAFIAVVIDLLSQLPTKDSHQIRNWLIQWFIKGAIAPIIVWILFNTGIFQNLPDFVSSKMLSKMGWNNTDATLLMIFIGIIVITTFWTAVTSGWLIAMLSAYEIDKGEVFKRVRWFSLFLVPLAGLIVFAFGWGAIGVAGTLWLLPIVKASTAATGEPNRRTRPSYSKATVHLQRGKYEDAEQEVLAELERCDDDFDGWMLLAELYANHFQDLPAAARMIGETCEQPATTVSEVAVAYHRLADWHMKLEHNPEAAIKALEHISARYPRSHVDRMARLRIKNIQNEQQEKNEEPRTIRLPSLGRQLDNTPENETNIEAAASQARRCTEVLKKNPNDIPARETFARILAEQLGKADVAIEQLHLLIDLSAKDESAERKMAEWLALIAAWQLKYLNDEPSALATMRRLIQEHPQTGEAFAAQRRLHMIEMERRLRAARFAQPPAQGSSA